MHEEIIKHVELIQQRKKHMQSLVDSKVNAHLMCNDIDKLRDEINSILNIIVIELLRQPIEEAKNNLRTSNGNKFYFKDNKFLFKMYRCHQPIDCNVIEYGFDFNDSIFSVLREKNEDFIKMVNKIIHYLKELRKESIVSKHHNVEVPFVKTIKYLKSGYNCLEIGESDDESIRVCLTLQPYYRQDIKLCDRIESNFINYELLFDDDYYGACLKLINKIEKVLIIKLRSKNLIIDEIMRTITESEYNSIYIAHKV